MKFREWDKKHARNLGVYTRQINAVFDAAIQEAAALGASISHFNPDKPFDFTHYPQTQHRLEKLLNRLQNEVQTVVLNGIDAEWTLSNNKNNELAKWVFGDNVGKLSPRQERQYFSTNDAAREAFIARKTNGLDLSDRIWKYTDQFKDEIEMGLDLGLRNGRSAAEIARELKQYLQEPDRLYRNYRDEHGELHILQNYHPGQGTYRSSRKNAERVARTETNMAYRQADHERWQQMDFVVGIEIVRSNNPYQCTLCESLAGKYPKSFQFTGWHPQCRCFVVPILKTTEELREDTDRILEGEKTSIASSRTVTEYPRAFKSWVQGNEERIARWNDNGALPYFLKNNRAAWKDLTSIEVINQQVIERNLKLATSFDEHSKALANSLGVYVTDVNIKSQGRIIEKAIASYQGDVYRVGDIVRNTFICEKEQIGGVIEAIKKEFNVERYKMQSTNMGYTGHLFNVWVRDGVRAEVQVNTPQMIYAKDTNAKLFLGEGLFNRIKAASGMECGLGHTFYEEYRVLETLANPTAAQIKRLQELERQSRAYYKKIESVKI